MGKWGETKIKVEIAREKSGQGKKPKESEEQWKKYGPGLSRWGKASNGWQDDERLTGEKKKKKKGKKLFLPLARDFFGGQCRARP